MGQAQLWRILTEKVELLRTARQSRQAVPIASRALTVARKAFAPDDARLLTNLELLGDLAMDIDDPAQALEYYTEAVRLCESAENLAAWARLAPVCGSIAWSLNDMELAVAHFRTALKLAGRVEHPPDTANIANSLALILLQAGNGEEAERYYEQALTICRERAGAEADTATVLNNLGIHYYNTGRMTLAENVHNEAYALRQALDPANPAAIAQSASNLAAVLHATDRHEEAEAAYETAIATIEQAGISPTADYITALENYAALLRQQANNRKARQIDNQLARLRL